MIDTTFNVELGCITKGIRLTSARLVYLNDVMVRDGGWGSFADSAFRLRLLKVCLGWLLKAW
jgi:hypothetical protein